MVNSAEPFFSTLDSRDLRGSWEVLFFYPFDFTFGACVHAERSVRRRPLPKRSEKKS